MKLQAGSIHLHYDKGFLRTLTAENGEEVVRMIYFALRDRAWNTARFYISNEQITANEKSFKITYTWQADDLGMNMTGSVAITGEESGQISYAFYGKAENTFWRNRIGLCVLHPLAGVTGQSCSITTPSAEVTSGRFPKLISPHQPFLNIASMRWKMASGSAFQLTFSGDTFETEDQRNWTDASFKTYSTPLSLPLPVKVEAGTEIRQSVVFQPVDIKTSSPTAPAVNRSEKAHHRTHRIALRPRIGVGQRADAKVLSLYEAEYLRAASFSHLRADVSFVRFDWNDRLRAAVTDAVQIGVPLEVAFFLKEEIAARQVADAIDQCRQLESRVGSILLFEAESRSTTDKLLRNVVPYLRARLPHVKLGGGTDCNFAEFNRMRFNYSLVDFVTYSINPQVHASDSQTLMENLGGQADTVLSAKEITGGKPVHIAAVTLLPRFNPAVKSDRQLTLPPADARQRMPFCAEWTRGSIQTLTEAGAAAITYFETHGPRGLLSGDEIFPVLDVFTQARAISPA